MKRILLALVLSLIISPAQAETFPRVIHKAQEEISYKIKYSKEPAGFDVWQISTTEGDCEDIALAKRQYLIDKGWDENDLKIAILKEKVQPKEGPRRGHAVLLIVSRNVVLDSLFELEPFNFTSYLRVHNFIHICNAKDLRSINIPASARC